jgi:hypothetical protein
VVKGDSRTQQKRITPPRARTWSQLNWLRLIGLVAQRSIVSERFKLFREFSDGCKLFRWRHILPKLSLGAHAGCSGRYKYIEFGIVTYSVNADASGNGNRFLSWLGSQMLPAVIFY